VNTPQSPVGVQGIRRRRRLVVIALVCLFVTACSGSGSDKLPPPEISTPAATVARDYWPTDGWRTAAPNDHGIDATTLAQVDDQVAAAYPRCAACWWYSNASSHLLSAIVANASGQSTLAYARAKLFDPLGIRTNGIFQPVVSDPIAPKVLKAYEQANVAWPVDPQGYHLGYSGLKLPARDLAKFGFLCLNSGRWEDSQLIPAEYVAAATSPNGSSPNLTMGYGWHWWVAVESDHRTFSARGYGGQFIYVVPDLDFVAVITGEPETRGVDPKILITRTIIPAVRS
jgi:CubicO group peptidase (beta-lactamase class C family)